MTQTSSSTAPWRFFLLLLVSQFFPFFPQANLLINYKLPGVLSFFFAFYFFLSARCRLFFVKSLVVKYWLLVFLFLFFQGVWHGYYVDGPSLTIYFKIFSYFLFFWFGVYLWCSLGFLGWRYFLKGVSMLCCLHLLLYADFVFFGVSAVSGLFQHAPMQGRFGSSYSWPYNFALYAFIPIILLVCSFCFRHSVPASDKLIFFIFSLMVFYSNGSRSFLIAFALILIYLSVLYIFSGYKRGIFFSVSLFVLVLIFSGAFYFKNDFLSDFRYFDFSTLSAGRAEQSFYLMDLVKENFSILVVGLGSTIVGDFYIENGLNFILRFGVLGFLLLAFIPLKFYFLSFLVFFRLKRRNEMRDLQFLALIVNLVVLSSLLMLSSANVYLNDRYMMMLMILLGYFFARVKAVRFV